MRTFLATKLLKRVSFPSETTYHGRNGFGRCTGVEIWHGDPTGKNVYLQPITSRGEATGACTIQIPTNQTLEVAFALSKVLDKVLDAIPDRLPILLGLNKELDKILEQKLKGA